MRDCAVEVSLYTPRYDTPQQRYESHSPVWNNASEALPRAGLALTMVVAGCVNNISHQESLNEKPEIPETPSFGLYAEIPYDQMDAAEQEGSRSLIAARRRLAAQTRSGCTTPSWRR